MKILRNASDRSENRYAPLQEHKTSVKENTYEPLTLDRSVQMLSDADKNQGKELLRAAFSLNVIYHIPYIKYNGGGPNYSEKTGINFGVLIFF